MEVKHCGHTLSPIERELDASPKENALGINSIKVREYWCPDQRCRKRLIYWKDADKGEEWARVRPHEMKSFKARLRRAKQSDWVKSWRHTFPFTETKAWVE